MYLKLTKANWKKFAQKVNPETDIVAGDLWIFTEYTNPEGDCIDGLPRSILPLHWNGKNADPEDRFDVHRTFVDHGHVLHIYMDCGCDAISGTTEAMEFFMNKYLDEQ